MLSDIKDEPAIFRILAELYTPLSKSVQNVNINTEKISKIFIVASGSSRNAANIARYFIECVTQIPVTVEYASEFASKCPVLTPDDLAIFVSQSGETSDVLSALQVAKIRRACTFAITNNENSTIHKAANSAMLIHAGKETSIPATKSFSSQLLCLYIVGLYLAEKKKTLSEKEIEFYKQKIHQIADRVEKLISSTEEIDKIAETLYNKKSLIILGRGQNFGLAEECALKIKETCYINAAGYPTGEFLHGHLALVDENCPVISIVTPNSYDEVNYTLCIGNTMQLIKKRNADVVILKDSNDDNISAKLGELPARYLGITDFDKDFSTIYASVVLHLLAYKMAILLGNDVNNPRSLSKTVYNND